MTTSAEFNFYSDPEAAYVVLNQLKSPITMVTWETCDKHALPWVILLWFTFYAPNKIFIPKNGFLDIFFVLFLHLWKLLDPYPA